MTRQLLLQTMLFSLALSCEGSVSVLAADEASGAVSLDGNAFYLETCSACHGPIGLFAYGTPSAAYIADAFTRRPEMAGLNGKYSPQQLAAISQAIAGARTNSTPTSTPTTEACTATPTVAGKTLYKRMNTREYLNSVRDLFGDPALTFDTSKYPLDYFSTQGFDNDDASIRTTPAEAENLTNLSIDVATRALANPASPFNACKVSTGATAYRACLQKLFVKTARQAFRRPIATAEVSELVDLAVLATDTPQDGVVFALASILVSPRFLFHLVDYTANRDGALHTLSQHEFASRLSFWLWSSIPDDALLTLADANQLMQPEVAAAQVDRMLASPKAAELMRTFPSQWLGYRKIAAMERDLTITPQFTPTLKAAMAKEGELVFTNLVQAQLPITSLATADSTFANRELAAFYGLTFPAGVPSRGDRGYLMKAVSD